MTINGYETKTTFWQDFSIADMFGVDAIKDTYNRAFEEWKHDTVYLTELSLILNWKIWEHYEKNDGYGILYSEMWGQVDSYACENLDGDDLTYYLETTD